jgi:uncharacterized protein YndB with AHSA1/START domain
MATVAISHDQDAIQGEVQIAAPPERVFQALTDPRQLMQWWGQKGMYHGTDWKGDVRPGGKWRCEGVSDVDGAPYHVGGEYVEVDPPRLVFLHLGCELFGSAANARSLGAGIFGGRNACPSTS